MKRIVTALLALVLAFSLTAMHTAALTDKGMIETVETELPLRNPLAIVQQADADEVDAALSAEIPPDVLLVNTTAFEDLAAFLSSCMDGGVIPMLQVDTVEEAHRLVAAVSAVSCKDLNAVSSDEKPLAVLRNRKTLIRTGLIVTLESDTLTSKEAHAIRQKVRSAPATFCVLQSEMASVQVVSELQELALAVWVQVDDAVDTAAFTVQAVRALTSGANGVITPDAAALVDMINETFEEHTMTRTPIFIGHRGNPSQAPENSLSGFITAYQNGADVFELDVEITKDGEIIIMHDDTLNRTTDYDGDKSIGEMTLSEIKTYRLLALDGSVSEESVPTLREVLEEFRDKDCRIFVEFKGYKSENVTETAKLIAEYDMADRVDVISFNTSLIAQTQNELEGMSTGYLHMPSAITITQAAALDALYPSILASQQINSSINPNKGIISDKYLQAATERGITVWPWTYLAGDNTKAFMLAPDGITTDDVQWAKDMPKTLQVTVETDSIAIGKEWSLDVEAVTYGRMEQYIGDVERIVTVIDGEECLRVDDGTIHGEKSGEATVIIGYKATTPTGGEYVLYTQPITVKIVNVVLIVSLIAGGGVIAAMGIAVLILFLRKRRQLKSNTAKAETKEEKAL